MSRPRIRRLLVLRPAACGEYAFRFVGPFPVVDSRSLAQ